jgi:GTP-binding protein
MAYTSKAPGKTRACNVFDVDGRFYLVDLPGYGYAKASFAERRRLLRLVRSYLSSRPSISGVIWLLDIRRDPSPDDLDVARQLVDQEVSVLVAITKADKLSKGHRVERTRAILNALEIPEDQCVVTSARTRDGIEELRASIHALVARGG